MSLLGRITGPTDFKGLSTATLAALAEEIRAFLIDKVSGAGGHLGPNLGAVELTIATHRVFDSPRDVLLFDTGHQAYLHKILTGRCAEFDSLRQAGGLSGYPSRAESVHDVIENSHASTALSYADGLAKAFALRGGAGRRVVAIIGDGALTGGMCWEALMWDASVLPVMPYLRLAAPRHCARLRELLREAIDIADGPTVIRYPQATAGPDIPASGRIGQCDILRDEPAAVSLLVAVGSLAGPCLAAADELAAHDVPVTVIDPRWVAPLDQALLKLAGAHRLPSRFLPARLPGPDPACSRPGRGRHRHRGAHTTRQHPPREDRSQGDLMTAVDLGMPAPPSAPAVRRRASRQVMVGGVPVGGDAPVSVQSMTTTRTSDIDATLQQIAELTAAGCQIVRVAVPSQDDANALPAIAAKSQIPVIADIHFQPRYVFAAIDAGCAAVRVNPGNIKKFDDKVKQIAAAAAAAGVPIRIGVNAGSLDPRLLAKHGHATPEALVESALWECSLFEEHGFGGIKISVKHHDPLVMIAAYRRLAARCDYPLHLGVTEAGPLFQGTIKSAVAFGVLLAEGIGDTIRVSLSAPPVEEVKVGNQILESLGLRPRQLEIVSCPSCGRAQVDVYTLAEQVTAAFDGFAVPLRVAVMGCVVNGPGEAREADLGVSAGNGKGQIFVHGKIIKTVPEDQIVQTLLDEARQRDWSNSRE